MEKKLPNWDLNPIYPLGDSSEYENAKSDLTNKINNFSRFLDNLPGDNLPQWISQSIDIINEVGDLIEELGSYIYCQYSTDTQNSEILKELNSLEISEVALTTAQTKFRKILGSLGDEAALLALMPDSEQYHHFIAKELYFFNHQMSLEEENLAAELSRSGADSWSRLHNSLSSTVDALWDETTGERKTVIELRAMAFDPDPAVREKAYRMELELWKSVEKPLAASLNGIKGTSLTLGERRNYSSPLEASLKQARISQETLNALIGVMSDNLGVFRRYLKAKARYLGKDKVAFFDLFAPVASKSSQPKVWSFQETQEFITLQFSRFSKEMGDFAKDAFDKNWIDAGPRSGKVGGAYCTSFPLTGESRILCNFDGSFDALTTVAHELGHGYHHHVLKDATHISRQYPMTLAETASIFAETVVFNQAYGQASEDEKLSILETSLSGATQVIVDILSRFKFESAVFEKRKEGEISPDDFSALMLDAQRETYGEAMDDDLRHPYMWAVKGHYYIPSLDFYNFPYAFGQLFGMALYGLYQERGEAFVGEYNKILSLTGLADAEEVTATAGFDITKPAFWQTGIDTLEKWVDEYEKLIEVNLTGDDN